MYLVGNGASSAQDVAAPNRLLLSSVFLATALLMQLTPQNGLNCPR